VCQDALNNNGQFLLSEIQNSLVDKSCFELQIRRLAKDSFIKPAMQYF